MPRAAKDPVTGLTEKQTAFVLAYLATGNGSEAYRRAYDCKKMSPEAIKVEASRLLDNTNITLTLSTLRARVTDKAIDTVVVDKEWVIGRLARVVERCMQAAPVMDKKGNPVYVELEDGDEAPAFVFNSMGANRALELLGKEIGLFVERKETGKPGEFKKVLDEDERTEMRDRVRKRFVKLGLGKVVQIGSAKRAA